MGRFSARLPKLVRAGQLKKMHVFELRRVPMGFELRGGQLTEPMMFRENEPRPAVHLVGFLSQIEGGQLRILDATGEMVEMRRYEPVIPMGGAVGGLYGLSNQETGSVIHP